MIVFLQNAWSPVYAGGEWPRASWLVALKRSRSGQRLRLMVDHPGCCYNTTPIVGATPDSIIPPDSIHILKVISNHRPNLIVACGKQAEHALRKLWHGPLLAVPHPAHRLVTNALYARARKIIDSGFADRIALRQGRNDVVIEKLS